MAKEFEEDPDITKEVDAALDEYEKQLGLPSLRKLEAPSCLNMTVAELRKKSPEDLEEAVFEINQYGLYIQREINRNRAWERWGKAKINELAAMYLPDVSGNYGYNGMELIARNSPPICKKINAFLRKIGMQLERLHGIPEHIKIMADTIRDLKFAAIRREKNYGNPTE